MKLFQSIFVMLFFLSLATPVHAAEANVVQINNDTVVSEVMTYNEIINQLATSKNISLQEAYSEFPLGATKNTRALLTYRTVAKIVDIDSTYKVTMRFYCETSEGSGYWGIKRILNVEMNRNYNGISKQFGGNVYTNLESAYKIFVIVNGDFYNNGTTTYNGGVDIGIGKAANIGFSIGYASNHFKYAYRELYLITQN